MNADIAVARAVFAQRICWLAGFDDPNIVAAFAKVPRERFVGAGPWRIVGGGAGSRTTPTLIPNTSITTSPSRSTTGEA